MDRATPAIGITTFSMIDANLAEESPLKMLPIGLKIPENEIASNTGHLFLRNFKPPKTMNTAATMPTAGTQLGKLKENAPVPRDRFARHRSILDRKSTRLNSSHAK